MTTEDTTKYSQVLTIFMTYIRIVTALVVVFLIIKLVIKQEWSPLESYLSLVTSIISAVIAFFDFKKAIKSKRDL